MVAMSENLRTSSAVNLALAGQLTALAVILQATSLYLPLLGEFCSHFATLVIALAAGLKPRYGLATTFSAGFLLLFFSPKQIPILLFFDGPLGIWAGWGLRNRRASLAWFLASVTLFLGISALTRLLGIPFLRELTEGPSGTVSLLLVGGFSSVYCYAWFSFIAHVFAGFKRRFANHPFNG